MLTNSIRSWALFVGLALFAPSAAFASRLRPPPAGGPDGVIYACLDKQGNARVVASVRLAPMVRLARKARLVRPSPVRRVPLARLVRLALLAPSVPLVRLAP